MPPRIGIKAKMKIPQRLFSFFDLKIMISPEKISNEENRLVNNSMIKHIFRTSNPSSIYPWDIGDAIKYIKS